MLAGLRSLGRLDRCEAVLSGYLGRPETWNVVLEALADVREARPDAWFVCDPVLGDEGELYLPAKLVRTFREQAVPRADLLVPNRFELEWLVDRPVPDIPGAVAAAADLHAAGAREVVVKGLVLEHDGRPTQHVVGLDDDGAWVARAPHVAQFWSGSGDVFTALVTGLRLAGTPLPATVARATALMEELVARTHELRAPELRMVEIDWASEPPGRTPSAWPDPAHPASRRAASSGETLPPESTSTVPGTGSTSPASNAATGAAAAGSTASLARA